MQKIISCYNRNALRLPPDFEYCEKENNRADRIKLRILLVVLWLALIVFISRAIEIIKETSYIPTTEAPITSVEPTPTVEQQIRQIAEREGFDGNFLVNLAFCESSLRPTVRGDGGLARGLYQIRSDYWPEVSDMEADDIDFATTWTINKLKQG